LNSWKLFKQDISPGSVVQTFHFLDVPPVIEGDYTGNMTFKANSTL
jgi:hypothetical protein